MELYSNNMRVNLQVFEGPLDLLLHLIKKNDLDIYNIPIALVLDQYFAYLEAMRELDIDLAGEFLVLASELAHIKSRLLVEKPEEEEAEEADPRAGLVARLLEYQRYKKAAAWLLARPMLNRDVFCRPDILEEPLESPQEDMLSIDPFTLVRVFQDILKKAPKQALHEVETERVSVTERIYEVLDFLKTEESIEFEKLFSGDKSRLDLVVTFLAILEMAKLKMVSVQQTSAYGQIWIKRKMEIETDSLPPRDKIEVTSDEVAT